MKYMLFGCWMLTLVCSCQYRQEMTAADRATVKDSVSRMMTRISTDITKSGPTQWLNYFEDDPGFFMSSDGAVKFGDFPSATSYTRDSLPKMMSSISLSWTHVQVDPLDREYASIGADFSEDVRLTGGQAMSFAGFFTAIAHFDGTTWKLRNLNWATKAR